MFVVVLLYCRELYYSYSLTQMEIIRLMTSEGEEEYREWESGGGERARESKGEGENMR